MTNKEAKTATTKTATTEKATTKTATAKTTVSKTATTRVKAKAIAPTMEQHNLNGGTDLVIMNEPKPDVYSMELVSELKKRSKAIKIEMGKVESSFIKIAFNLTWISESETFKALGYDTIYSYAKEEHGIARGTCSDFINVVKRFGARLEDGTVAGGLKEEFKGYQSSKLIKMHGMSDEQLKVITPDMSVREIDKIRKASNQEKSQSADKSADSAENVIDVESKEVQRQIMLSVRNVKEYEANVDKIHDMIMRALKDPKHVVEIAYTF